ncbi:helix-turn-helix domain-containing protein [Variovorax paradoxus]|jgi:AraC-like DNA-binding protein|uniref:AraC-like ligand-binding domain-containing protein n=1 Tax=Variovorax paradoxus TaxID=34073 RepID=UPI003AAD9503
MFFHYSTEELSRGQKTEYWQDSVRSRLIPAAAHFAHPMEFDGSLTGHELGALTVCQMQAGPHSFARTEHLVRTTPEDDFVAAFVKAGSMRMAQNGQHVSVGVGGIVLLDSARPFIHDMDRNTVLLVRVPRQQLLSRFPKAEYMMGCEIAKGSPMGPLLHSMADEAFRQQPSTGAKAAQARFAAAFLDTLTAAMEIQVEGDGTVRAPRYDSVYQKAVKHIEANLDNCDLDSNDIALAAHTSPRTLARIFAMQGTTVMHYVWKRRLDTSFNILSEGRVKHVSQAAYQCGFNDLSHFSRAFKNTFGSTPKSLLQPRGETVVN